MGSKDRADKEMASRLVKEVERRLRKGKNPDQFLLDLANFLSDPGKAKRLEEQLLGPENDIGTWTDEERAEMKSGQSASGGSGQAQAPISASPPQLQIPDLPEVSFGVLKDFSFHVCKTDPYFCRSGDWHTFEHLERDEGLRKEFFANIKDVRIAHQDFSPTYPQIKFALAKLEELLFKVEPEASKPAEIAVATVAPAPEIKPTIEAKPEPEAKAAEPAKDPVKEIDPEKIYFALGADWYSLDEIMADAAVKGLFQKAFVDLEKGFVRVRKNRFAANVAVKDQNLSHLPEDLKEEYRKLRAVFLGPEAAVATEPAKTDVVSPEMKTIDVALAKAVVTKPAEITPDPQAKPKLDPLSDEEIDRSFDFYGYPVKYSISFGCGGSLKDIRRDFRIRQEFREYRTAKRSVIINADGRSAVIGKANDGSLTEETYRKFRGYLHLLDRLLFATDCGDEKKPEKQEQPKPDEKSQAGTSMSKPKVLYGLFGYYLGHHPQSLDEIRYSKDLCERYRKAFVGHVNIRIEAGRDSFTMEYQALGYAPYMSGYRTDRAKLIKCIDELWEVVFECEGISAPSTCQHGSVIGGRWVAESNIQKYPRLQEAQKAERDRSCVPVHQTGSPSTSKGDAPYPMGDIDDLDLSK